MLRIGVAVVMGVVILVVMFKHPGANGLPTFALASGPGPGVGKAGALLFPTRIPSPTSVPGTPDVPPPTPPAVTPPPPVQPVAPVIGDGLHTPAMGWNHYNAFGNAVNEALIRQIIDAMATNGMRDAGYRFINIDDSWESDHRNPDGTIAVNGNFPSGIKALADYAHSKGFKLGIYTSPADRTCNQAYHVGSPGQQNAQRDVAAFAAWGIDYIKLDWCGANYSQTRTIVGWWHAAIVASGRPIVLSINDGSSSSPWTWAAQDGTINSWRVGQDICQKWDSPGTDSSRKCWAPDGGIINIINSSHLQQSSSSPGAVSDPDMLEVGDGGLSYDEQKSHFSMWCIVNAPLIAGNDPRALDAPTSSILLNQDVIAIDQDALVRQGKLVSNQGGIQTWVKDLADGGHAVLLLNTNGNSTQASVQWASLGLAATLHARDLWAHQNLGAVTGWTGQIPTHGVMFFRVGGSTP